MGGTRWSPAVRSGLLAKKKRTFLVRRRDPPQVMEQAEVAGEADAKTVPKNPGKIEVSFYAEGGDLVAGLENRVYFTCRGPQGKPVAVSGVIVAEGRGNGDRENDDRREDVAAVETSYAGMGVFSLTPQTGGKYRLRITSPAGVNDEPKLPEVSAESERRAEHGQRRVCDRASRWSSTSARPRPGCRWL